MQQITSNVFVETQVRGCNFGYVTTSDGIVMIDSPQLPSDAIKLNGELQQKGHLRYIINTEPHGDHWTGNAYFDVPVVAHEGVRTRILNTDMEQHKIRVGGYGPGEAHLLENYLANPPVITFKNGMTMHVGDHTFEMIHMPGHTLYQAAILIKEEGVVFTSDNIFHKVHTWLQEANPDLWLVAVESLRRLDEEIFVRPEIVVGRTVMVRTGPLTGLTGIVRKLKTKTRITVNVDMVGQSVSLDINANEVELEF